jgi:ribosome maturation factor RimP
VSVDRMRDHLVEVLTGPVATVGLDVEAIEVTQAGKRRVLRVAVDKDGGVTMDDIADATREVSRVLDDTDAMGAQAYTLEVSSPGTDRPLVLPRHWRRNRGRLVKVSLRDGSTLTGRVTEADDTRAVLDVDGATHEVPFDAVTRAKVQIEFTRRRDEGDGLDELGEG